VAPTSHSFARSVSPPWRFRLSHTHTPSPLFNPPLSSVHGGRGKTASRGVCALGVSGFRASPVCPYCASRDPTRLRGRPLALNPPLPRAQEPHKRAAKPAAETVLSRIRHAISGEVTVPPAEGAGPVRRFHTKKYVRGARCMLCVACCAPAWMRSGGRRSARRRVSSAAVLLHPA
jgi:hypothetical protein